MVHQELVNAPSDMMSGAPYTGVRSGGYRRKDQDQGA